MWRQLASGWQKALQTCLFMFLVLIAPDADFTGPPCAWHPPTWIELSLYQNGGNALVFPKTFCGITGLIIYHSDFAVPLKSCEDSWRLVGKRRCKHDSTFTWLYSTITWLYYYLLLLLLDFTTTWLYYYLLLLLLDSTTTWLYYHLTLLSLDFSFTWLCYCLTLLLLDSTIAWLYCYLTLPLLDSTITWL